MLEELSRRLAGLTDSCSMVSLWARHVRRKWGRGGELAETILNGAYQGRRGRGELVEQEVDVATSVSVHRAGETRAEADLPVPATLPQAFCKKSCSTRLEVRFDLGVDLCFSQ